MAVTLSEKEQRALAKGKCPHCGGTELQKIDPDMRFRFYLECTKCRAVYYCHYPDPPVLADWVGTPLPVFWREREKGMVGDGIG